MVEWYMVVLDMMVRYMSLCDGEVYGGEVYGGEVYGGAIYVGVEYGGMLYGGMLYGGVVNGDMVCTLWWYMVWCGGVVHGVTWYMVRDGT